QARHRRHPRSAQPRGDRAAAGSRRDPPHLRSPGGAEAGGPLASGRPPRLRGVLVSGRAGGARPRDPHALGRIPVRGSRAPASGDARAARHRQPEPLRARADADARLRVPQPGTRRRAGRAGGRPGLGPRPGRTRRRRGVHAMIRRRLPIGRSRRVSGAWVAQHVYFGISDVLLWVLSYALALLIRFDGAIPPQFIAAMPVVLILFLPVKLAWNAVFRLYRVTWALVGLKEIVGAWKASTAATLTLAGGLFLLQGIHAYGTFPRGVLILDYLLGTTFIAVSRLGRRLSHEIPHARSRTGGGSRVLLVGAGEAGGMIARSMVGSGHGAYHPVGFIDDDASKWGTFVHGLKVMGGKEAIPDAVRRLEVDEVVITFVAAGSGHVRDIMRFAREAGITRVRVLPSVHELLTGHVTVHDIRDVNLEDLLGRKPAPIDANRVAAFLRGQTVLVTGAAGSIGSELARQLSRSDAARVLLLDTNETALFHLAEEIIHPPLEQRVQTVIADVRDSDKIQKVFSAWRPDVVYHAAAYKHVPLMERHPDEAVRTNILGTLA